jgi:hypothetical protein
MSTQFIVQMENRPGAIANLARAFASAGVNIREIGGGGGGGGDVGYAVVTADDDEGARAVLRAGGFVFREGDALIVEVPDHPGGLAEIAGKLEAAGVNIQAILFLGRREGAVETAITVDDVEKARAALR